MTDETKSSGDSGHTGREIRWRLHLPVVLEDVFRTLDTAEGRAKFWAEAAEETDGVIAFRFINGQQYQGRILERTPPRILTLDYFGSAASFALSPDAEGGTELTLTHGGVPPDQYAEVMAGWCSVLLALKAWLVSGVDLRNHDPGRTWDQGYVDQ